MMESLDGFPQWLSRKESARNAGDMGLIPGSRRSSEGGNGISLQNSCLKHHVMMLALS